MHSRLSDPWQTLSPVSLGPVGRNWQPRLALAGTYDATWLRDRAPFLPADFNALHWQSAPADQQVESLDGGTPIELRNLGPYADVRFVLPTVRLVAQAEGRVQGARRPLRLDTLLLQPDRLRFSLVWRTHWQLGGRDVVDRIEVTAGSPWPAMLDGTASGVERGGQ